MVKFNRIDLEYILRQIEQAEAGQGPVNPHLAFGLREVLGTNNSSIADQAFFGAADRLFPRVTEAFFRTADPSAFGPPGGPATSYAQTSGFVFDSAPRTISNLIADQTANNAAALQAQEHALAKLGSGYLNQVPNPNFNPAL